MIRIDRADFVFQHGRSDDRDAKEKKTRKERAPKCEVKIETRAHLRKMSILVTRKREKSSSTIASGCGFCLVRHFSGRSSAHVAELADAYGSGSYGATRGGSSPLVSSLLSRMNWTLRFL